MGTRRDFIKLVAVGGGGLVLGVGRVGAAAEGSPFRPNAWLRIEADGSVAIKVGKSEMGQGVRTALPMIVAEELDVGLSSVRVEQAQPGPDFQELGTGGSRSVMTSFAPLRRAGAAARTMLVGAAAARWGVPEGDCRTESGAVLHPPSGRRLAYRDLLADAARQPVPESPRLKQPSEFRLIGRSQPRVDGPEIVAGRARYGMDVRLPGLRYAVVARPPVLGAKVASFEAAAAKRVSGVREVVEISSGVAVVADSTWSALRGRDALVVKWTDSPHAGFGSAAHTAALEQATASPGLTIRKDGDGRDALARAARRIEALYLYPFAAHAAVEPVNSTALVRDGRCRVWSPTQAPNTLQEMAASVLAVEPAAVEVDVTLLGGGFGRRLGVDFDRDAVEVARAMSGTPVQVLRTREDDMVHGYFQAASAHRLIAGLDADGRLVALEHRKASTPHNARRVTSDEQKKDPKVVRGWTWGIYDQPYFVPAFEATYGIVEAPVPIGPWRSVFSPSSVFARECFVDEIAQATGKDPLALRLELLGASAPAVAPTFKTSDKDSVDRVRMRRVLEVVAEKAGFGRGGAAGRALGLAGNVFHSSAYIAYVVEVSRLAKPAPGRLPFAVQRVVCAIDCGRVINPDMVAQQVESGVVWSLSNMKNEITFKDGRAEQSSYGDFPVVTIEEAPRVETHLVGAQENDPSGIGETVVCPLAPAVANALSRLIGRRIRRLPVTAADLA
jgi:CO/xanthine dehydrogenase Mo-binding subunit